MKKILKRIFRLLILIATTVCGVLALFYGDSHTSDWQTAAATVFGLSGMVAVIGVFRAGGRWQWRFGHLLLFVGVLVWWLSIAPSNAREWQTDVAQLAYATVDGDKVTLHNIRNFDYRSEFDYLPAYYKKVSISANCKVSIYLPFTGWVQTLPIPWS